MARLVRDSRLRLQVALLATAVSARAAEAFVAVGQKMWRRTDGAILWSRGDLVIRVELPAAHESEHQLKLTKEEKARASVPQF